MAEQTAQDATDGGQGHADDHAASDTAAAAEGQRQEPETFARDYVATLRSEAAGWRTKARQAEARLQELEDAQKSEAQKAIERAERAEAELGALRAADQRREAAQAAGLPLEFAGRVQGDTPEAMAADAKELAKVLRAQARPPAGSYDNGAGDTGDVGRGGMDALIREAVKR